ncbi:MAG: histidine--tRNA ligase, partial [Candidatus Saccharimonadales bacterium]|nr:histidine--tRNA ligase [Candidatus Saccharimonadales bacterium]
EEYDAPLVELTDIYKAKTGDEIVNEQMYSFTDRGGRDVSIRPEMTPSVSRMVAGKRQELAYPLRWYSIPNLWRYERPQKGRLREHWQLNVDIFGVQTIDAELEMILLANDIMKSFGASKEMYEIKLSSRKLVNLIMAQYLAMDVSKTHKLVKLLDKKNKLPEETFFGEAHAIIGEDESTRGKFDALMNAKSMAGLPDELKESEPVRQVQILFTLLNEHNVGNAVFDVSLMRGFDYYTDIVFEVYDTDEQNNRSIMGGGRYDGLVGLFGTEPVPTVGFGLGDVTMREFLEGHDLVPELRTETDAYLAVIGEYLRQAQGVAAILREEGINVAVDTTGRKLDKQIKTADKKGIKYVLFVGEEELNEERFTLKDIDEGREEKMSLERVISKLAAPREEQMD